jgi:hypothetical protein
MMQEFIFIGCHVEARIRRHWRDVLVTCLDAVTGKVQVQYKTPHARVTTLVARKDLRPLRLEVTCSQ